MKKVYLVDVHNLDGSYLKTTSLAFVSRAAAMRYADDCDFPTQIKQVDLISLSDF